jgi:hypothetical protein
MKTKLEFGDTWNSFYYKGTEKIKQVVEDTQRILFPPKILLLWKKDTHRGIVIEWLGYYAMLKFLK